ncbi:hypothetical protein BH10CYA1_BH10CYA1_52170 [soil metagenome]
MPVPEESKSQVLKGQITTWGNRAEMARKQGNDDLVQQAMARKRQYENELAKLQEFEVKDET